MSYREGKGERENWREMNYQTKEDRRGSEPREKEQSEERERLSQQSRVARFAADLICSAGNSNSTASVQLREREKERVSLVGSASILGPKNQQVWFWCSQLERVARLEFAFKLSH